MGGYIDLPALGGMSQTTGNCNIWPYDGGTGIYNTPTVYCYHTPQVECSGDIHVFPCPHCDKCKCGKATVKREAKKKC